MKTVVVFGTFDVIHPGHRFFLSRAREKGDRLVASIARDAFVRRFKNRDPVHDQSERLAHVLASGLVDDAVLSDEETGTYSILEQLRPDVVCLGHDQKALHENLLVWLKGRDYDPEIVVIESFAPERYKSSILNSGRIER
jgi:FAD synthetase